MKVDTVGVQEYSGDWGQPPGTLTVQLPPPDPVPPWPAADPVQPRAQHHGPGVPTAFAWQVSRPAATGSRGRAHTDHAEHKTLFCFLMAEASADFFYLVTLLSLPSLGSPSDGSCEQAAPGPCFMHEDVGAVIYPVSTSRHRSCGAEAGGGQVRLLAERPETGALSLCQGCRRLSCQPQGPQPHCFPSGSWHLGQRLAQAAASPCLWSE